jgi:peptidyl-prolyl cis-trans isomerase SurA
MRNILAFCLTFCLVAIANAQTDDLKAKTLFSVDGEKVTAEEYMAVYNKNRDVGENIDPKTPKEYLDLYINFKLKVHKAKELGRDTMPKFLKEYRSYREQLAEPYLSDNAVTEELVREAYQREKYDVRASHIMVSLEPNATPADTAEAYNKIIKLKESIEAGLDFEAVAKESSADKYSAERGGDLGYFTVFNMVYPFESAAYNTPVGEISKPVRSQYGYHIVKTTDKRPARGTVTVAHIMIIDNDQNTEEESTNAKAKIQEIYEQLQNGADFGTLAKQHSDDKSSALQGGFLQPFGINKMYPAFEEAAFSLNQEGDYTKPIKTPVGWHIIKLIEKPKQSPFTQRIEALQEEVERDARALQSRESVIKRIKKDYAYKEFPGRFNLAFEQVDEALFKGNFSADKVNKAQEVLFQFADKPYTVKDFLIYIEKNQRNYARNSDLEATLYKALDDYSEGELLEYEKSKLSEKYPQFRLLDREYFEGILLFDLTEEMVWKKALKDSAGLAEFYRKNQDNYRYGKRYQVILIDAINKKVAKNARKALSKKETIASILKEFNENSKLNLALDSGVYEIQKWSAFELFDPNLEEGFSKLVKDNGRVKQLQVLKIIPPAIKPFEDAKGKVISDYQDYLEKRWLEELKQEYTVDINQKVLNQVVQELEK